MTESRETFEARTAPLWYFVWLGIWGGLSAMAFYAGLKSPSFLQLAAILIVICIVYAVWLHSFYLQIQHRRLTYKTLFGGTRSVHLDDIERGEREVGPSSTQPFYRLRLVPKTGPAESEIRINTAVLREADVAALYERLSAEGIPVSH